MRDEKVDAISLPFLNAIPVISGLRGHAIRS